MSSEEDVEGERDLEGEGFGKEGKENGSLGSTGWRIAERKVERGGVLVALARVGRSA